jgi:hypothetical protein
MDISITEYFFKVHQPHGKGAYQIYFSISIISVCTRRPGGEFLQWSQ